MLMTYTKKDGTDAAVRLKAMPHAPAITIGRGKEANVILDDEKCSRIHVAIRYWDDIFVIRDMKSSNGTYMNGEKIEVAKLSPGDVIRIGNTELTMGTDKLQTDVTVTS